MAGRMHPGKQPSEQNKTKFVLMDAYAMLTTAVVPHKAPAHPNASNCIKDALKEGGKFIFRGPTRALSRCRSVGRRGGFDIFGQGL